MRWFLLSTLLFLGCNRVCSESETLSGLDGGAVPCVQNTDCPRPSSVLVCGQEEDRLRDCIDCSENRCVRYRPVPCT